MSVALVSGPIDSAISNAPQNSKWPVKILLTVQRHGRMKLDSIEVRNRILLILLVVVTGIERWHYHDFKRLAVRNIVKPTDRTPRGVTDALMLGGYLPSFEMTLRLGREVQDEWMNAYQDVQISNTFKKILRLNLGMPVPSDA